MFNSTSLPPIPHGSIRLNCGSPESSARSSHAESLLQYPTWPASCAVTSTPIQPTPDLSSGNTQTRFAASALTNSLRQATSAKFCGYLGARPRRKAYLIRLLNPIIRGCVYYHHHIEARSLYRKTGMVLWHSLWRWAKRRHPSKSPAWIVDRYWHRLGRRKWCFAVLAGANARRSRSDAIRLVDPTAISIRRHVKVKSDANPFDPHWCSYC
jgi:hypothetical protein